MAIGKPGGIDASNNEYESVVELRCLSCHKVLDHHHPEVAALVESVL